MCLRPGVRRHVVALAMLGLLTPDSPARAQIYEVLSSFTGAAGGDGVMPHTVMIPGPDGSLYGSTPHDASAPAVIYRVGLDGVRSIVYRFADDFGTAYCSPSGKLAVGMDAALYGLADGCGGGDGGILFRLAGTSFTVLHRFEASPATGLARGADGRLYGAANPTAPGREGIIFAWDGAIAVLQTLAWLPASVPPEPFHTDRRDFVRGELTRGRDGSLYFVGGYAVTTPFIFERTDYVLMRITPAGVVAIVNTFPEDVVPAGAVLPATDGSLCGSYVHGSSGFPVPLAADLYCHGMLTAIPPFGANATLIEGLNGSVYGTTPTSSGTALGTIFRLRADGTMTTLHEFDVFGGPGERFPTAGLTRGADGHLYGTTQRGGTADLGVVFRFRLPAEADASANGQQGPITVGALDRVQVSFAFHAGPANVQDQAELYAAVVTPWGGVYWLQPDLTFGAARTRLYAGALPSFGPVPLIDVPFGGLLPAGDYYWVMIVDADTNGVPNGTYVDVVKTTRR